MLKLPNFQQTDSLWANQTFSTANLKIKDYGCAICSLANLAVYYGEETLPNILAKQLKFSSEGSVFWDSITSVFPKIKFINRHDWTKVSALMDVIDDYLAKGKILIVSVKKHYWNQEHFITLWDKCEFCDEYICSSPLHKNIIKLADIYGTPSRAICKVIVFDNK